MLDVIAKKNKIDDNLGVCNVESIAKEMLDCLIRLVWKRSTKFINENMRIKVHSMNIN